MIEILPPCKKCWLYLRSNRDHPACRECNARILYADAVIHDIPHQKKAMRKILAAIPTKAEIKAAFQKQMEIPSIAKPDGFKSTTPPKQRTPKHPITTCLDPNCDKMGDYARGYCRPCYQRLLRNRKIGEGGVKKCKTKGCEAAGSYAAGYCGFCYGVRLRLRLKARRVAA